MQATPNGPLSGSRTNAELNLSVLQRHYPSIVHVLSIAPYAVIYTFSTSSQAWEKTGIEGTLFVCQLAAGRSFQNVGLDSEERYAVIVLNRRGLDNFELELCKGDDVEITEEYVILQGDSQRLSSHSLAGPTNGNSSDPFVIYGLWIFAEPSPSSTADMRIINAKVIQDCALRAEASRETIAREHRHLQQRPAAGEISSNQLGLDGAYGIQSAGQDMQYTERGLSKPTQGVLEDLFRKAKHEYNFN